MGAPQKALRGKERELGQGALGWGSSLWSIPSWLGPRRLREPQGRPTDISSFQASSSRQQRAGGERPTERHGPGQHGKRRDAAASQNSRAKEIRAAFRTRGGRRGPRSAAAWGAGRRPGARRLVPSPLPPANGRRGRPGGRGGSRVLSSVTRRRCAAALSTPPVPCPVWRCCQVSALALRGRDLGRDRGAPHDGRRGGRPARLRSGVRGLGSGGNGLGTRWASAGGQAPPLRPFYVAGGGHRGAGEQWAGAQPRRAGTWRIPAPSGGRAGGRGREAGGRERLGMWHLRLPERAEPGRPSVLQASGPRLRAADPPLPGVSAPWLRTSGFARKR